MSTSLSLVHSIRDHGLILAVERLERAIYRGTNVLNSFPKCAV